MVAPLGGDCKLKYKHNSIVNKKSTCLNLIRLFDLVTTLSHFFYALCQPCTFFIAMTPICILIYKITNLRVPVNY